jgi:two-component system response regulator PfeR
VVDRGRTVWILHAAPKSRDRYRAALGRHHRLRFVQSGRSLREWLSARGEAPDVLIADLRRQGETILDLLRSDPPAWLRPRSLVVVSWVDDLDLVRECFALGAAEYISAPFQTAELRVKVERILRSAAAASVAQADELALDPRTLTVRLGRRISDGLTAKEFQILSSLVVTPGRTAARSDILRQVWREARVEPKTLDVHLSHLRRKVERLGLSIHQAGTGRLALSVGEPSLRRAS